MSKEGRSKYAYRRHADGGGSLWFGGFIGALIYFLHFHSGTVWLVILAFLKATIWPVYVVYGLLNFLY